MEFRKNFLVKVDGYLLKNNWVGKYFEMNKIRFPKILFAICTEQELHSLAAILLIALFFMRGKRTIRLRALRSFLPVFLQHRVTYLTSNY